VGTSLLSLPLVQDAIQYALAQLADWQQVPSRVQADLGALKDLASQTQDPARLALLTTYQQALQGVQQQYTDSALLLSGVLRTASLVQAGGTPDAGAVADAGKLAGVMASGLGALAQIETELVGEGANLSVGSAGTPLVPTWAKWSLIGLGLWWFYRAVLRG
jgi:hypothetical protein